MTKMKKHFKSSISMIGYSILVAKEPRETKAKYILDSPVEVHQWLKEVFL